MNFDVKNHKKEFPHAAVQIVEGRLYGVWMQGNFYKRKVEFHGAYPPSYIDRVFSLFPNRKSVLHLFSGSVAADPCRNTVVEYTLDISSEFNPDVVGKAEEVDHFFPPESFDLGLADPPYTTTDAAIYGHPMPNIPKVTRALRQVMKKGGIVAWISTKPPMYRKVEWDLAGLVMFHVGTNRAVRCVTFLRAT